MLLTKGIGMVRTPGIDIAEQPSIHASSLAFHTSSSSIRTSCNGNTSADAKVFVSPSCLPTDERWIVRVRWKKFTSSHCNPRPLRVTLIEWRSTVSFLLNHASFDIWLRKFD